MPSLNTGNAILSNPIKVDSSYNVGIGGAASGSFKLQVTGTTNLTGALTGTSATFSGLLTANSGITNNTNAITIAAATTAKPHFGSGFGATFIQNNNYYNGSAYVYDDNTIGSTYITLGDSFAFGTGAANTIPTTKLTIANNGAATFSSSVNLGTSLNSTTAAMVVENAGIYGSWVELKATSTGGKRWLLQSTGVSAGEGTGKLVFNNASDAITAMTITSGGNVGIGTSSPSTKLHIIQPVGNDAFAIGETGSNMRFRIGQEASYTGNYINSTNIDLKLITYADGGSGGNIYFYTSTNSTPVERMRINNAGAIKLNSADYGNVYNFSFKGANGGIDCFAALGVATNSQNIINFFNQGNSFVAAISVNASTVSYGTGSDYRLKKDFKDFNGLEKVSAIKVYDFKFKAEGDRMEGVIAHELQEVIPYAVTGYKDEVDAEGNDKIQNVDYSKIVPVLVKAIQEQQAQIEELKAMIAAK